MATTEIIFNIEDITVGREFMWMEPGNLTFKVMSVHEASEDGFAGKRLGPYASVVWSDDNGKESGMSLTSIVNYYRTGQIT